MVGIFQLTMQYETGSFTNFKNTIFDLVYRNLYKIYIHKTLFPLARKRDKDSCLPLTFFVV